jgi:hypothetical protein
MLQKCLVLNTTAQPITLDIVSLVERVVIDIVNKCANINWQQHCDYFENHRYT